MKKAGGVVGVIGGCLGIVAGAITWLLGNLAVSDTAAELMAEEGVDQGMVAEGASQLMQTGLIGIVCSVAVLITAIVILRIHTWIPGAIMIVLSVLGVFFGGFGVAFFMIMAGIGGILALVVPKQQIEEQDTDSIMRKAGGIVTIVGACLGLLTAIVTLFLAGLADYALDKNILDSQFEIEEMQLNEDEKEFIQEGSTKLTSNGWWGVACSILTIIAGIVAIKSQNSIPGLAILLLCLTSILLSGAGVAVFMGLASVGGILALFPIRVSEQK